MTERIREAASRLLKMWIGVFLVSFITAEYDIGLLHSVWYSLDLAAITMVASRYEIFIPGVKRRHFGD